MGLRTSAERRDKVERYVLREERLFLKGRPSRSDAFGRGEGSDR
jgi:hypothetical protein